VHINNLLTGLDNKGMERINNPDEIESVCNIILDRSSNQHKS